MATDVIISVDETADFDDVVARLRQAGLAVREALAGIGTVSGTVAPEHMAALAKIPGVAAVELSTTVDIGPPGSGGI